MNGSLNNPSKNQFKIFRKKLTRTEVVLAVALVAVVAYLLHCELTTCEKTVVVSQEPSECADPSCYESIIEIQNFVDPSVDPCEDFHQFSCGNFLETAYKKQLSDILNHEEQELSNELDAMIFEPIFSSDSKIVKIQKTYFRACIKANENKVSEERKLLDLVLQVGIRPLQKNDSWNEDEFDSFDVIIKCKKLGLPFQWFLEFGLHADEINYLKISYPNLSSSSEIITKNKMKNMTSRLLKRNINVTEIFNFEQKLIKIIRQQKSEISLNTVEELNEKHPTINWLDFLQNITDNSFEMTEETVIASNVDEYMMKLHQLLKGTPKYIQANYILWKIIEYYNPYMSHHVNQESRLKFCKEKTRDSFPYLSEIAYIKKYSVAHVTKPVRELTNFVHQEFLNRIQLSSWWNTTAGEIYSENFNKTEINIGLSFDNEEGIFDDEFVDANYLHLGNLSLTTEKPNFIEIITERSKYYYQSVFSNINQTHIETEEKNLLFHVAEMKIFFHKSLNTIIVPPSMLHGFLYDYNRPQYLNFASLGYLLAKEFVRSLQILNEEDKNVTNAAFEASNRCFEDDYDSQMENFQINFDSSDLIQEILPDILARHIAYTAYQSWVETNGEEMELPLLTYSPNQLFWIKSSSTNCKKNLGVVEDETDFDPNVSKYKNILSVRHSPFFASDFNCSEETPMNPTKKC